MKLQNVADMYPLSPMQQLMLMQSLADGQSGLLFEQLLCTLRGWLQPEKLQQAWQLLIERHAMLRTAFLWEGLDQPIQIVRTQIKLPWTLYDWRELAPDVQQEQLEQVLQADRQRGFTLIRAPLFRLTLIQVADDTGWFVWSRHHILLDGWSGALLLKELFALYDQLMAGQLPDTSPPRPFRDYIAWLQQHDPTEAARFWRQQLHGFQQPTTLALAAPPHRSSATPQGYAEEQYALSAATTAALNRLSRQQQLTLTTLIEGTWALLLHRYSGQSDVLFGNTVSGRPAELEGIETMIGQFINNLPMRVQVSPDCDLLSWLRAIQANALQSRQYEHIPLPQIQEWSDMAPGMRLFDSIVIVNYVDDQAMQHISSNLQLLEMRPITWTNFPLTLLVVLGNPITLRIKYDCRRFAAASVRMLADHFAHLLAQISSNPQQPVGALTLLTEAERQRLLEEWNHPRLEYDRERCLHHIFEAQAARTPDALAVLTGTQSLTYAELNQQANRLAHAIMAQGILPGATIALYIDQSPHLLVGLLALFKAGMSVLPLDTLSPPARISALLTLAQTDVVLTHHTLAAALSDLSCRIVDLDSPDLVLCTNRYANPALELDTTHPAYYMPVSLPTGISGLVTLDQRALVHMVAAQWSTFALPSSSRVLLASPPGLDRALFEIGLAWSAGAALCLAEDVSIAPTAALLRSIQQHAVTHLCWPASLLPGLTTDILANRHLVLLADTPVPARTEALLSAAASCFVVYGTPETTAWATVAEWKPGTVPHTIGRPAGNTTAYVLDQTLQPVPVGIPGDLYIGGDSLAQGYVHEPGLNAERFITHPFSPKAEARLYRTGDRVRYQPDGTLEWLGHNDRQLRIQGICVEPAEVERAIEQHPGVERAVVVADDQSMYPHLTAYIEACNGQPPASSDILHILSQQLHAGLVPATISTLERLPLRSDGTIDYRGLPAARATRPELATTYVAPDSELEVALADIWQELLGIRHVGIHDHFFALGGNSLHATQIISRLRDLFPLELPLHTLFEHPTISQLAAKLENMLLDKLEALSEEEAQSLI